MTSLNATGNFEISEWCSEKDADAVVGRSIGIAALLQRSSGITFSSEDNQHHAKTARQNQKLRMG